MLMKFDHVVTTIIGHKTVDDTYRTQKNVVESLNQNTSKSYENPQSLFLASNTCFRRRKCLIFGY